MRRWLPVILATGATLGVVVAYLIAGGASYEPLSVADPCEPRSEQVLAERGVFEGILLSGLDGAACELGVSREELVAALTDEAALAAFTEANDIDPGRVEEAIRAGLLRAIDDAEMQGRLSTAVASVARGLAENAPVGTVVELFGALPGDPSVPEVIEAIGEAGLTLEDLGDAAAGEIEGFLEDLGAIGSIPDGLGALLPEIDAEDLPEGAEGLLPDEVDPGPLRDELDRLFG
jgi:hypothetical protein